MPSTSHHTQPHTHSTETQLLSHVVESPLQVQVGCHTDDLTSASKLSRAPVVTYQCSMDRTTRTVACLWGGLLYVIVPKGSTLGPVSVTIRRAVPAPYYKLGEWTERGGRREIWGRRSSCGLLLRRGGRGLVARRRKNCSRWKWRQEVRYTLCPQRLQGRTGGRV